MVHGVGIDIVSIPKFSAAVKRRGTGLYKRLFTEGELAYCLKKRFPERHLAARFAVKVSLFKAMGRHMGFLNVEVISAPGGAPELKVKGAGRDFNYNISISHTDEFAVAETVVEKAAVGSKEGLIY
jgi:holo-[acyl-carrier protein] synthase